MLPGPAPPGTQSESLGKSQATGFEMPLLPASLPGTLGSPPNPGFPLRTGIPSAWSITGWHGGQAKSSPSISQQPTHPTPSPLPPPVRPTLSSAGLLMDRGSRLSPWVGTLWTGKQTAVHFSLERGSKLSSNYQKPVTQKDQEHSA